MPLRSLRRWTSKLASIRVGSRTRANRPTALQGVEVLEGRELLSTFTVSNLSPRGAGSLRKAILLANANPGADTIAFSVTGTIRTGCESLPAITDRVTIDGSSAPGFAGTPLVTVDFQGHQGLRFKRGSDGSVLSSLSLVKAGNAGVTLRASNVTVEGNYIGLLADGTTVAGNKGDGVRIMATSRDNLIGRSNAVTSITYADASKVSMQPVSGWQGIRGADTAGQFLITGTSGANGLLFIGGMDGVGTSYSVNFPGATTSSVYGPDNLDGDLIRLVGSYKTGNDVVNGFVYEGTTAGLGNPDLYRTIDKPGAKFNYVHSTMGGFAVGNYDGPTAEGQPVGVGRAYIYNLATSTFVTDIMYPGALSNTAYGIWHNGNTSYTIVGGYSLTPGNNLDDQERPIGEAYIVDYDSSSGLFSNWKTFNYPNGAVGRDFVSHFEGISSVEKGVYTLSADSLAVGTSNPAQGSLVSVRRNTDGSFGEGEWVDLNYTGASGITSSNSVYGNQVVGIVIAETGTFSYQATVNVGFQLSNVISGNKGNGVAIEGASGSQVAMNYIGTDVTGTLRRGNRKNGIHVTKGAARNLIGGQATGANNPTAGVFVRPPQGNLISGNGINGVLINKRSTENVLSGNFVGTAASGNTGLGNAADGVAIVNADRNQLIGCTFQQDPFVFYNVISGNGGNGVRVTDSNDVTIHANFMGVGANNASIVANKGDGLLVSGSSANTQVGGVIPLGNVISGNDRHGIEVKDTATGFVSFNTFAGLYAFSTAAPNKLNGIMITSTGGNNLIRTCVVSGNLGHGIEIGGDATGVEVTQTTAGTDTNIQAALPNGGSGIVISGNAHGNAIGGFQPSIEPQVNVAANKRYGIEIIGSARNNSVFNTYIGTNTNATLNLGNTLGGLLIGPGTSFNTIGGVEPTMQNKILYSGGAGVILDSSRGNVLLGNQISNNLGGGVVVIGGTENLIGTVAVGNTISNNGLNGLSVSGVVTGTLVHNNVISGNANNGVALAQSRNLTVGGSLTGTSNRIVTNQGYGLEAIGDSTGTLVQGNTIEDNTKGNVDLSKSTGIVFIP